MQEDPFCAGIRPVALDGDPRPVRQAEPGDVDRLAHRVLAEATGPTGAGAAGEAAEVIDARDPAAEFVVRQGLHHLALEFIEAVGHRATHRRRPAQCGLDPTDPYRSIDMASRGPRS